MAQRTRLGGTCFTPAQLRVRQGRGRVVGERSPVMGIFIGSVLVFLLVDPAAVQQSRLFGRWDPVNWTASAVRSALPAAIALLAHEFFSDRSSEMAVIAGWCAGLLVFGPKRLAGALGRNPWAHS